MNTEKKNKPLDPSSSAAMRQNPVPGMQTDPVVVTVGEVWVTVVCPVEALFTLTDDELYMLDVWEVDEMYPLEE